MTRTVVRVGIPDGYAERLRRLALDVERLAVGGVSVEHARPAMLEVVTQLHRLARASG